MKSIVLTTYTPYPSRKIRRIRAQNFTQHPRREDLYSVVHDQEVILFYKGLDVPTRHILDLKGVIPSMQVADAKKAIQDMVDHSQKWHNRTSTRTRNMPEDIKVPLILKRPFLSTAHAKLDVFKKKIALRVWNDKIVFESDNHTSNIIKRVYVLGLRERMEIYLESRLIGEALILNRSLDAMILNMTNANFFPILSINVMSKRFYNSIMKDKIEYLGKNVVGAFMNVPIFVDFFVVTDFAVVENMDAYRDQDMDEVIVGKPFCKASYVKAGRFDRMVTINNGNDSVTYQMARSHPSFKHLTNKQCNKIWPLLKVSARDKLNGISHPYNKLKSFYNGVLDLGP
ncbi:hypothetical protein Tco_1556061 [Tanacetum coccineum]